MCLLKLVHFNVYLVLYPKDPETLAILREKQSSVHKTKKGLLSCSYMYLTLLGHEDQQCESKLKRGYTLTIRPNLTPK